MRTSSTIPAFRLRAALVLGLTAAAGAALAQQPARPATPTPAPAAAPDPALEAAQKVFDALPESERKAIQNDLIWGSDFTATISGSFGKRTYDAIVSFQKAAKLKADGILDANGRKLLADAATRARTAAKFAAVTDPKTGASVGVPAALLSKQEALATGTRWSSANNEVVLETAVAAGGAAELPAAFERVVGLQAPGRKVTYKLLRPDFFVVAGEMGTRSFYTRYGIGPTSLRGYSLSYPTAAQKAMERTVIAVANSYNPAPGTQTAAAPGGGTAPVPPSTPPVQEMWPAGVYQTGIVVAPGRIVTAARVAACAEPLVNRKPVRVTNTDREAGFVILEGDTGQARPLAMKAAGALTAESAPVVLGFAHAATPVFSVWGALSATSDAAAPRVAAPLPREAGGSVVLDRKGGLVGLIAAPDGKPRLVAGLVPAVSHKVIPAQKIAGAAGAAIGPSAGGPDQTAGSLAAGLKASLVAIECGKPFPRNPN